MKTTRNLFLKIAVFAIGFVNPIISTFAQEQVVISVAEDSNLDRRNDIDELFKASAAAGSYHAPQQEELKRFESLVITTLDARESWKLSEPEWRELGWNVTEFECGSDKCIAISERAGKQFGRGLYLIRLTSKNPICLQAPHRYFDLHTGTIGLKMFEESQVWAAAFNTLHRKKVDAAHEVEHYLNAFTRALLVARSELTVVQLHGFSKSKFEAEKAATRIIVSDGSRHPNRLAHLVAMDLKEHYQPNSVRLYPLEIRDLGGTKNVQALTLRSRGSVGFLHLELHPNVRKQLKSSKKSRAELCALLARAVASSGN